ncbi:hypothetical protein [Jiulongibacter sp. NS-SX5]|uniref:hypothetical protein n=1 Tax=Jiulongibacter sp. NS-SX5 TaxID=3463854 RepID=UPI00405870DA
MTENYSSLSLQELQEEQKKIKKSEMYSAAAIGGLVGIALYAIFTGGFNLVAVGIPAGLIYLITRNSKKSKDKANAIKEEIARRS